MQRHMCCMLELHLFAPWRVLLSGWDGFSLKTVTLCPNSGEWKLRQPSRSAAPGNRQRPHHGSRVAFGIQF